jgi:hypothetical protein
VKYKLAYPMVSVGMMPQSVIIHPIRRAANPPLNRDIVELLKGMQGRIESGQLITNDVGQSADAAAAECQGDILVGVPVPG